MKKFILTGAALCLLLSGCAVPKTENTATAFVMNTVVNIKAEADNKTLSAALDICRNAENSFSRTLSGSDIYGLNQNGSAEINGELLSVIGTALEYCEKTDGKFDITLGALADVWNFSGNTVPSEADIRQALKSSGYKKLKITGNRIETNGVKIDLGAAAKGYAANKIRDYFREQGVKNAEINLGGNILVMGDEYSVIGIKNPQDTSAVKAKIKVKNSSVVTSGTYERFIEAEGKKYHHILDSATGYPAETQIASATVICEDSLRADILSTVCVALGNAESALEFINGEASAEVILIDNNGGIHISSGIFCEDGVYRL